MNPAAKYLWLMMMIIISLLDNLTTHLSVGPGVIEVNPVMNFLMNYFGLIVGLWIFGSLLKIAFIILAWILFENIFKLINTIPEKAPRVFVKLIGYLTMTIMPLAYVPTVINNYFLIR